MKTFNVTFTAANGDNWTLEFKAKDRSKCYTKASQHAREYYNEPMRITIEEKTK